MVTRVLRIFEGERSGQSAGDTSEVQTYLVEVDSVSDSPSLARVANDGTTAVPIFGSQHPQDAALIVKSVEATRDADNPTIFNVTVTYGLRDIPTGGGGGQPPEQEKWNVDVSFDAVEYQETVTVDRDGKAIANSAGQAFDPPIEVVRYDEQMSVSFNTTMVDLGNVSAARGKINSDTVSLDINGYSRTFAPLTLKLVSASYHTVVGTDGQRYWDVQYVFIYRADGWVRKVVDRGYYEKIGGQLVQVKDKYNEPLSTPTYLDGNGRKLTLPADAVLIEVPLDHEATFGPLFAGL